MGRPPPSAPSPMTPPTTDHLERAHPDAWAGRADAAGVVVSGPRDERPIVTRAAVLIPTYNRARLLRRAIESALAQTYQDLTVVVADNASTDETPRVVEELDDPRLVYLRHPSNLGQQANFDFCLGYGGAEYVKIMTDDDVLYPSVMERSVRVLDERPRVGLVHTAFDLIGPDDELFIAAHNWTRGLTQDTIEPGPRFVRECMRWSNRVCFASATFRATAVPGGGWRHDEFPANDLGLWLRIAVGWDVAYLSAPLVASCMQPSSISAEAIGQYGPTGYAKTRTLADKMLKLKLRLLAESADLIDDPRGAERLARACWRRDLVSAARDSTLPERRLGDAVRALYQVGREHPRALLQCSVPKDLLAAALGSGSFEWLKGRLGRAT